MICLLGLCVHYVVSSDTAVHKSTVCVFHPSTASQIPAKGTVNPLSRLLCCCARALVAYEAVVADETLVALVDC